MRTLRERVAFLLEERGITQAEATRRGGFSNPAFINDILRGQKVSVRGVNLERLARALDTTEAFLIMKTDNPDIPGASPVDSSESVSTDAPTIPERDIRAGTSYGGGVDSQEWAVQDSDGSAISGHRAVASWGLPPSFVESELGLKFGHADILQITGDSMDDQSVHALISGDRVIVDRRHTDPRQGGVFAVWDGDGVVVKQVELVRGTEPIEIICKSRNPRYDPFKLLIDGNAHIIGRVAGKICRM